MDPPVVAPPGEDDDRDRQEGRDPEVRERRDSAVRVVVLLPGQEGEQAGQPQADGEGVAEPRPSEQVDRSEAEPAGDPDRADQVPRPIERFAPAEGAAEELRAGRQSVPQHPHGPDQLIGPTASAPLSREDRGEDEAKGG